MARVKKNNVELNEVGKGILDTLQENADTKEENNNDDNSIKEEEVKNTNNDNNKKIKDLKSKRVKEEKIEIKEKNKRSFMLNDNAIQQLKVLNMVTQKDLSEIVNSAVEDYFKKNKKKVEQFLDEIKNTL